MKRIKPIETEYDGYIFRSPLEARWAVFLNALGVKYEYEPEGFELASGKRYLPDFRVRCHGVRGACIAYEPFDLCGCCAHSKYMDSYSYQGDCSYALNAHGDPDRNGCCFKCDNFKSTAFDLYIEVKGQGRMSQDDADRIIEFSGVSGASTINYSYGIDYETVNPTLVVGDVPRDFDEMISQCYEQMNGIHIYPYNYETIDGDCFGAYPTAQNGRFYLMGDDSNYTDSNGIATLNDALKKARQARFEYGQTPTRKLAYGRA